MTPPGGQRPEHARPAFTTDLIHELPSETAKNMPLTDILFD
ncbi:hypothetical protein [Xenorhabdus doucetiae]|nr:MULTISPECIES: hypothetical protein [unclassified Xenorhabdus]